MLNCFGYSILRKPMALVAVCAALLIASPVHAALTLTLTPEAVVSQSGQRLTFLATLTNTGSESTSLLGAAGNFDMVGVTWDDNDFLNNLPATLSANDIYTGDLFVDILLGVPEGVTTGTYSIQGESISDPFLEGSDNVAITILEDPVTVPEPTTLTLVGSLVVGASLLRLRHPSSMAFIKRIKQAS